MFWGGGPSPTRADGPFLLAGAMPIAWRSSYPPPRFVTYIGPGCPCRSARRPPGIWHHSRFEWKRFNDRFDWDRVGIWSQLEAALESALESAEVWICRRSWANALSKQRAGKKNEAEQNFREKQKSGGKQIL